MRVWGNDINFEAQIKRALRGVWEDGWDKSDVFTESKRLKPGVLNAIENAYLENAQPDSYDWGENLYMLIRDRIEDHFIEQNLAKRQGWIK